jgi:hypothetical protein
VRNFSLMAMILSVLISSKCMAEALRIDLGMDTGRNDTATPGWQEWQVKNGAEAVREFDDVTIKIRPRDGELRGNWYKAGLLNATMATDGVVANGFEIEITGLKPGFHSLTTYHNAFQGAPENSLTISASGESVNVQPSVKAASNEEAESAFVEFEQKGRLPSVINISSNGQEIVLNGLVIDGANPKTSAHPPTPHDNDHHVDGDSGKVTLQWKPAANAVKHHVFLAKANTGDEVRQQVASAETDSPLLLGTTNGSKQVIEVDPNASNLHYAWRVDSEDANGKVSRGDVWNFRVRHLAFPGAEGYGRFAIGGRGGRVIKVTNLNDSGPGSLRAAVEAEGPRTVVFDVSGRINLDSKLIMRDPYMTVAGQTAPGKGVCISNYNFGMLGNHDCIIRFMRVRPGNTAGVTLDGMGLASCDHSIIDHCSISWTQDESFSSRGAKNITLQRTLISEALNIAGHKKYEKGKQHGFAASVSGDIGSLHHNLLAHCAGRNWSLAGGLDKATRHAGRLDIRNNVVYNWGHRTTDGGAKEVNFVNNYYKPGASTKVFHVLMAQREAVDAFGPQMYYADGNVMEGKFTAENKHAGVFEQRGEPAENWLVEEPFFDSFVTTTSANAAYKDVLSDVGCNEPLLDEHDSRVIDETLHGEARYKGSISGLPGLPDTQEDVGGWDDYGTDKRGADWDPDNDGLPTWWEELHKLNPNSTANDFSDANGDPDGDGFTNLEDYLAWLAVPHYETKIGETVEIDLANYARGYDVTHRKFKLGEIANGTAKLNENGTTVSFTPTNGFTGLAKFEYEVADSEGDGKSGHINIRVGGAN